MRFIHTADWHLGRYFHGVHLTGDQRQLLLEEFLPLVKESKAEAVVIAGDIYDRGVPPVEAVDLFSEVLTKLVEQKVKVLYIAGNHDSAARVGFGSTLLAQAGVYVRGELTRDLAPVVLEDAYGPVAFQLLPYLEPAHVRGVFPELVPEHGGLSFDEAHRIVIEQARAQLPAGVRSVAVAHAFMANGQSSTSERPLAVGGSGAVPPALFRDYNYTALGHLHNPQRAGSETCRYSGSLMKYSFDEAEQHKGVCIVELDAAGQATVETMPLTPPRDVRRLKGKFEELLHNRELFPASDDYIEAVLTDDGPVLDALARLRGPFPHIMHVERVFYEHEATLSNEGQAMLEKNEQEVFAQYYEAMTGQQLSAAQQAVLQQCLTAVHADRREQA